MINWILERGSDVRKLGMTNFKATGIEIVTQEESEQLCSPLEWEVALCPAVSYAVESGAAGICLVSA